MRFSLMPRGVDMLPAGIEWMRRKLDGKEILLEVLHQGGTIRLLSYEGSRDGGLHFHVEIAPGPYQSHEALADAVDTALRKT